VDAPARAVGEAVVAALRLAAIRGGQDPTVRLAAFATRALTLFGPRIPRAS
jgi:hypothetical protein